MANLTRRFTWKKWAPDIGENLELEGGPVLFLEIATGLTREQLSDLATALLKARDVPYVKAVIPEGATAAEAQPAHDEAGRVYLAQLREVVHSALKPYVRVFDGPHTVDGQQLANLDDYLKLIEQTGDVGISARQDIEEALVRFNSAEGPDHQPGTPVRRKQQHRIH